MSRSGGNERNGGCHDNTNCSNILEKSSNVEAVRWTFPNTNQCPIKRCMLLCSNRKDAVNHFRIHHADRTIICTVCGELFLAMDSEDFHRHCQDLHPLFRWRPRSIKMVEDKPQTNVYCWNCAGGDPNQQCSKCIRHFHQACVENLSEADWICDECTNDDDFKPFDTKFISEILKSIDDAEQFDSLKEIQFTSDQTINTIDFMQMKRKQYANVRQLEDDIKWFVHNCRTIFAQGCEIREASDGLIDYVNLHIQLIQACTHCYEDACVNSMSCSKHLLVWAKVKGHRYWPAKMMAVKVEKRKGYVRFFGDGAMDILSVDDCFLYSKNYPDHKKFYPTKLYNKAIKEANEYIENIRTKFGGFNYAEHRTVFEPEKLQDHLKQMIANGPSIESNSFEMDSNYTNTTSEYGNQTEKRTSNVQSTSTNNSSSATKLCDDANFNRICDVMKTNIADSLRSLNQLNSHNIEKIDHLQRQNSDLVKVRRSEKRKFEDEISVLNGRIATMEEAHRNKKQAFDDEKRALEQRIATLKEELCIEKKKSADAKMALKVKIDALFN